VISRGLCKSQLAHFRLEILTNSAIFHFFGQPPSSIWQRPKKSSDSVTVISSDFHPPWFFRQSISPIATRPIRAWEIDSGSSQRLGLAVRDSEIRNIAQKLFPALHDRHFQHTLHATHTQQNQQQNGLHCLLFHRLRRGPQGVQGPGAYFPSHRPVYRRPLRASVNKFTSSSSKRVDATRCVDDALNPRRRGIAWVDSANDACIVRV